MSFVSRLGRVFTGLRRFVRGALLTLLEREEAGPRRWRRLPGEASSAPARPPARAEPHGAARDERSFEQRRRGGPVTGEAPAKAHGPRHGGGGKRRGREAPEEAAAVEAVEADLPIPDYDQLSAREISARLKGLQPDELRRLRRHEVSNKHRRSIVAEIERRLAA